MVRIRVGINDNVSLCVPKLRLFSMKQITNLSMLQIRHRSRLCPFWQSVYIYLILQLEISSLQFANVYTRDAEINY